MQAMLVRLPTQERRDFELLVIHRLMHRIRLPAVQVEALVGWLAAASGVIRHRLGVAPRERG